MSAIVFKTTSGATNEFIAGTADYVLWYARNRDQVKYRPLYLSRRLGAGGDAAYSMIETSTGERRRLRPSELEEMNSDDRVFRLQILTSQAQGRAKGEGPASWFDVDIDGRTFRPSMQARWKTNEAGMHRLKLASRLHPSGKSLNYVRYHDDFPVFPLANLWTDTQSGSGLDKVYVVQTNTKVVERCMAMTTDPGDLVVDPTCGSGTTAFVAEQWGRRWITIDTSRVALALARQRLMGGRFPYYLLRDSAEGRRKEADLSASAPPPAPVTNDIRHGFVYERVQHVTLKSIANNPDIREGMSREEIDAAIRRHAEFEELVDKPYEDKRKVRVAGPFTVESLSPHRSLAFAPTAEPASEREAAVDPEAPTYEQTILENLRAAGVQNGRKAERLTFDAVDTYAGTYIQAVGIREDAPEGAPKRVGISIGPQYGTVAPPFVKGAAREATKDANLDVLCILGFAFDPQVIGAVEDLKPTDESFDVAVERSLGRVPVLLVRMNADLLMGEELKKTGAGNLFTVFGEPDITVTEADDGNLVVSVQGVDVFDPTTGEVRSGGTDQIALWMIDTDYDEESFFVRHCYFTGGQDPYKRLKQALKADIDEDAWSTLNRTTSRPFPKPTSGKIAVKVINDYGDEVVKVLPISD